MICGLAVDECSVIHQATIHQKILPPSESHSRQAKPKVSHALEVISALK
jgi:hypothetical protein